MAHFLNPRLVAVAAAHAPRSRSSLGALVLVLNALHSLAEGAEVGVPQREVAARAHLGLRAARRAEVDLEAAGLLVRASGPRGRVLRLVDPRDLEAARDPEFSTGCPQSLHSQGRGGPVDPPEAVPLTLLERGSPTPPNKDRARVRPSSRETPLPPAGARRRPGPTSVEAAGRELVRELGAVNGRASALVRGVVELAALVGPRSAASAAREVARFSKAEATSDRAALALSLLQQRARRARRAVSGPRGLFD